MGGKIGLIGIAIAHGLILSIMVSAFMSVSGGQLNPAVSLALVVAKSKISRRPSCSSPVNSLALRSPGLS